MTNIKNHPIKFIVLFYFACGLFRVIEYFLIRTDQSMLGEAVMHKLIGICLLAAAVWLLRYKWRDIGFVANRAIKGIGLGLLFGGSVFAVAYGAEIIMQLSAGRSPPLQFYVTSYAIEGNRGMQAGVFFVLICVLGNMINVIMEEGVFRGLFIRVAEEKYSFAKACLLSALLFGVWHMTQPVRNILDGVQSPAGALMMGLMLVATSALLGVQYAMLFKMTGAVWIGLAAHFVNNASVNLLHVVTASGVDEWQTMRIAVAQSLSFIVVLIIFLVRNKKQNLRMKIG